MACVLQGAITVKLVDVTLWRVIIKKGKESLEACYMAGKGGVLQSCSTIGEGGDTTIPSPGRSPKQPLPGIELHDPLHGQQTCPELKSFHHGVGQICRR